MPDRFAHCTFCGARFRPGQAWPRRCAACGETSYQNPKPVAVVLQPVGAGLLVVRRGIPPARGLLALPGGYIDVGETWQAAGARELFEEVGLTADAAEMELFDTASAPDGTLLVFGCYRPSRTRRRCHPRRRTRSRSAGRSGTARPSWASACTRRPRTGS